MCEAFGDRVSGANLISDMNGVGGSGGGDIAMATGGNSNSEIDSGSGVHDTVSVIGRGVVANSDANASNGAFGLQAPRGGIGQRGGSGTVPQIMRARRRRRRRGQKREWQTWSS